VPKFLDVHSLGGYSEDELKKSQELPRDEFGVKVLNILYNEKVSISFCLLDAPNREAVEKHHEKLGIKCEWITEVKTTAAY
jgi:Protein of unknown function (DUF4242)